MSASLSSSLGLSSPFSSSSLKMDEDAKLIEKQGIVSILGSDCERAKAASLRRTLSADMSSKKWLAQHGFSHMKKIASSQQFTLSPADSSSSEGEDEYDERKEVERAGHFHTWTSSKEEKGGQFDIWSSIVSNKAVVDSATLAPPYVHPLVKRSASCLSEKSLQICTESLGSETGSDGFSSYASSETGDVEEDKEEGHQQPEKDSNFSLHPEEFRVERYNYYGRKKLQPRSFPPPLPSLSTTQGPNLRLQTHRQNGRLVLEAVSIPNQNCFQVQRHEGRLVLTFANTPSNLQHTADLEQDEAEEFEQVLEENETQMDEDGNEEAATEEEEEEVEKASEFMEPAPKLPSGMINMHRSALMNKLMGLVNSNPTWPHKFNKAANLEEEEEDDDEEEATPLAQTLPPRPRVSRMISTPFNAYEYCWRTKPPAVPTVLNQLTQPPSITIKSNSFSKTSKPNEQQQLLLLRGNKAEYSVPLLRGCKEARRSLLIWEPRCIATS